MGINHRTILGFGLVAAFAVVVSCSSDKNGGSGPPAGFGKSCSSDKDCASYALLCGDDDECVQCLDNSDCKRSELCSAGLCRAADACESSRDCSRDQVCDDALELCVDCVTSDDCLNGQACVKNSCVKQQTCKSSRDCDGELVCDPDGLCVECVEDSDCSGSRVCRDSLCKAVGANGGGNGGENGDPSPGDGGGSGDTGGTGGTNSGGKPSGGGANGGNTTGGTGNGGGGAHNGGTGGTSTGGSGTGCPCTGTDVCTPDERCVAPTVLDDLHDCDDEILAIEGRDGTWAADADDDINLMYGFGNPGSLWADHTCAAWATGGIAPSAVDVSFAFIGFQIHSDGSAYDLSDYTGLHVTLESDANVQVVLKTTGGGYFEYVLTPKTGSTVRAAPFSGMTYMAISTESSLDLSTVYEVQFSPTDPTAFGMAIHRVELY